MLGARARRVGADPSAAQAVMAEAVDTARRLVGAEESAVFVHPAGVGPTELRVAFPDPALGPLGSVARTVADLTRLARQPVYVRDVGIDRRFEARRPGSAIGVPIAGPDGPVGALVAVSGSPDGVDAGGTPFLQSVGNTVGWLLEP